MSITKVKDIDNLSGTLIFDCLSIGGKEVTFIVYNEDKSFTEYRVDIEELDIIISKDSMASIYQPPNNSEPYIDHAPESLGYGTIEVDGVKILKK